MLTRLPPPRREPWVRQRSSGSWIIFLDHKEDILFDNAMVSHQLVTIIALLVMKWLICCLCHHFFLSFLCPPTSMKMQSLVRSLRKTNGKLYSMIPVVCTLTWGFAHQTKGERIFKEWCWVLSWVPGKRYQSVDHKDVLGCRHKIWAWDPGYVGQKMPEL